MTLISIALLCFLCSLIAYAFGFTVAKAESQKALLARRGDWLESLDECDTDGHDMVINLTRPL